MIRNNAIANRERLAIAEMLTFWRAKRDSTSDQLRVLSYQRIIDGLVKVAEEHEASHV